MATQMDAYLLLGRAAWMAPKIAYGDEQDDDDIGSASDSDSGATSRTSSSSDLADDASSTSSSSSSADDLFEMSALMTQLPIKRGLSRFFDGKSQSFASLAAVGSLEDLAKPARKRLKPSWSCGGGLDARRDRDRILSPRRHCPKAARKAAARAALSVLGGGSPRRPPLAVAASVTGRMIIGNALLVN